jgi:hypothetical protein
VLEDAEHHEAERDSDEAIAGDRQRRHRPPALEDDLVERQADLVAAVRHARAAEVHPRRQRRAGGENRPEPTQRLDVREDVHQGEDPHRAASGRAGEPKDPFLRAGPYRRERHHEARDD